MGLDEIPKFDKLGQNVEELNNIHINLGQLWVAPDANPIASYIEISGFHCPVIFKNMKSGMWLIDIDCFTPKKQTLNKSFTKNNKNTQNNSKDNMCNSNPNNNDFNFFEILAIDSYYNNETTTDYSTDGE